LSHPNGFDGPVPWDAVVRDLSHPVGRQKLNSSVKVLLTTDDEGHFLSVGPACPQSTGAVRRQTRRCSERQAHKERQLGELNQSRAETPAATEL
jgi:hypothetical protein